MSHQLWTTLIKWSLSPNQIYYLDCCLNKIVPTNIIDVQATRNECELRNLIDGNNNITPTGLAALNEFETFLVKTKKKVASDVLGTDFMDKIKEYRELFPAKRLPSNELARQSPQELKDKFVWFFKTHPETTWDDVLDATEYYISVFQKKGYMYMATSSNFIKKTLQDKTVTSKLADYCQELIDDPNLFTRI